MRYDYDMLGTRIHQASMEAGERWMLNDVAGKPIRAWNSRKYAFRTEYDELHRPLRSFVQGGDPPRLHCREILLRADDLWRQRGYAELNELQQRQANVRGKLQTLRQRGIATTDPLRFQRQSAAQQPPIARGLQERSRLGADTPLLEPKSSRAAPSTTRSIDRCGDRADKSIYRPTFNEANLLEKVDVNLRGAAAATPFVTNIDYNAKGQRDAHRIWQRRQDELRIRSKTFRSRTCTHVRATPSWTSAGLGNPKRRDQLFKNASDSAGLALHLRPGWQHHSHRDAALQTVFHNNQQVDPPGVYTYDALYRLIEAKGREHIGQTALQLAPPNGNYRDYPFAGHAPSPTTLQALRNYTEQYDYDAGRQLQPHDPSGGQRQLDSATYTHQRDQPDRAWQEEQSPEPDRAADNPAAPCRAVSCTTRTAT